MTLPRRDFLVLASAAITPLAFPWTATTTTQAGAPMYGLIGKVLTVAGQRDAFATVLLEGTGEMPGCLSYIIANDPANADALWITEVWDSQASHQASLQLPAVQAAIRK